MSTALRAAAKAWGEATYSSFKDLLRRFDALMDSSDAAIDSAPVLTAEGKNQKIRDVLADSFTKLSADIKRSYDPTVLPPLPPPNHEAIEVLYGDQWGQYRVQRFVLNKKDGRIFLQEWTPNDPSKLSGKKLQNVLQDSSRWIVSEDVIIDIIPGIATCIEEISLRVQFALSGNSGIARLGVWDSSDSTESRKPDSLETLDTWRVICEIQPHLKTARNGLTRVKEMAHYAAHNGVIEEYRHESAR